MSDSALHMLRVILGGAAGVVALKNRDRAYEVANPRLCQLFARAPEEIIGKTDDALLPAAEAEASAAEDAAVLESALPRTRLQCFSAASEQRWFQLTRSPILGDGGEPEGILLTGFEVTDWKTREDALIGREAAAAEAEQAREAHEKALQELAAASEAAKAEAEQAREECARLTSENEALAGKLRDAETALSAMTALRGALEAEEAARQALETRQTAIEEAAAGAAELARQAAARLDAVLKDAGAEDAARQA